MKKVFLLTGILIILISTFSKNVCISQWVSSGNGIPTGHYVTAINVAGNTIYAGTPGGIYKSTNEGGAWTLIFPNTGAITSFSFNGVFYFASTADGYWKSTDSGANWIKVSFFGSPPVWNMSSSNGNIYCSIGGDRVWKTTDNSSTWNPISLGGDVRYVSANEPYVYAGYYNFSSGGNGGVYKSSNSGNNWLRTLEDINIYCLAQKDSIVYAGAVDDVARKGGVYVSSNYGNNWVRSTLDSVPVKVLFVSDSYIFAGVTETYWPGFLDYPGFWVSINRGQSWKKKNDGFVITGNNTYPIAAITVFNNYVYTAISGNGIWKRPLSEVIGVNTISEVIPNRYKLEQNYPNPFNSLTIIRFQLSEASNVVVKVYDLKGKEISTILSDKLGPGIYETYFDGSGLSSGVYFYRMTADDFSDTKIMVFLK